MLPHEELLANTIEWLDDFCVERGFVDKVGRSKFARALNLLSGHQPKTKREAGFRDELIRELERRKSPRVLH